MARVVQLARKLAEWSIGCGLIVCGVILLAPAVQLWALSALLAFFSVSLYVFQPLTVWKYRNVPGPRAALLVGHLPEILKHGSMAFYIKLKKQYGPIFKIWFGRRPSVVVTDPNLARYVGTKLGNHPNFNAGIMRGEVKMVESSGLLAARGDYWRRLRSTWQPAFSPAALSGYVPLMAATTDRLVERLHSLAGAKAEGTPEDVQGIDMWRELGAMTLQVVGSTAYGVDFNAIEPAKGSTRPEASTSSPGNRLVEACKMFFRTTSLHTGSKWSRVAMLVPELSSVWACLASLLPDQPFLDQLQARRTLLDTSKALIQGWRDQHAGTGSHSHSQAVVGGGSFLARLLDQDRAGAAAQKLTDLQLAAQANTFTLAGYETTANGLAFTMFLLGCNPEAEAKLVSEVDALAARLVSEGRPGLQAVTMEDLTHLPYTEACFHEALRLYPPAHLTTRETGDEPLTIPIQGRDGQGMHSITIPPNTTILLSINTIHHDPELWPEPEAFKPERFLEKQESHALNHVPFGYGSRMCIGYRFALMEAKLALARLYHEFNFRLEPGQVPIQVAVGITQAPKHGVRMVVTPRPAQNA